MTDACRRMVSREPRSKFTKHLSIGQTPNHAKFHRAPPNAVREKCYSLFTPSFRGVARSSFWVGIIFYYTTLQSYILYSSLTTSAAISAQNNFHGLILGGYIYRYTPRRYAPAFTILAPQGYLLSQSSPIWVVMFTLSRHAPYEVTI